MSENPETPPPPGGQFLVYQAEDGKLKIDVRLECKTMCLTQQQMAELFQSKCSPKRRMKILGGLSQSRHMA